MYDVLMYFEGLLIHQILIIIWADSAKLCLLFSATSRDKALRAALIKSQPLKEKIEKKNVCWSGSCLKKSCNVIQLIKPFTLALLAFTLPHTQSQRSPYKAVKEKK